MRASIHTFKDECLLDQQADRNQISSQASLGRGMAAIRIEPDEIKTPVSMATYISHRALMR